MMIFTDFTKAQTRQRSQSPRAGPTGRALGLNPKTSSSSSSSEFSCPEEFGYFPHPSDCSLYYVCVFGGALLESCTGGLMYSHELQTCDWPRNVGCEMREITAPLPAPAREVTPRVPVSSRIRFSSLPTEPPSGPSGPSGPSAPAHIQQIQTLPPPPNQQRINPNPIITSRGQPKSYSEDEILKQLYAEAHDTLPPVEEEESDRQQRVYRGQPSTVTQVQRDRDGIIHQPSVNAIPTQQKGGSFVFNSQLPSFRVEQSSPSPNSYNIPQKSQIKQNKNYYNTSNYNPSYDPYYTIYDDEIYGDVEYSNQFSNQQKSTPSSTYRPTTSQSPQTFAPKPQTQPTTYLTQTQAPKTYNQQIYDYDEALVAQLEESDRYGQHERQPNTDFRTPSRNRGSSQYAGDTQSTVSQSTGRGTHPPRPARPTLKPSKTVVEHAQQYVDIYRFPPTRPEPLYPQPTPDKTAAKCRKDVCQLPDCYCGGKDIPADMPVEQVPQIVLLTFDDSVNDLNKQLYQDLFERGRVNPNGCPISATFYVSHEWTDYSQVQNLYSDGHEMASHTVSHSFGEQFSLKKWAREIAGQREILSAYGGVKQADIRGMRAPFLSIGGNKMFKMLHDFNFTYDSSMPVYENRPPSWPYTLDYRIFHDCMIPPCPTKSYPGVWEVPMVMWQDLNGGRCSMGDACSNPADADGVYKMIMKNFERHYTTNRAPFGLYYHAAWFTQPHHKEGFINFLDAINEMRDVYIVTNWQALQWVRDPTPMSRINSFQPFQCNYQDRPKRCNNAKVCNLWHKSGVRYMRTCQPCPEIYPWTGKSGIRSSRIDNDLEVVEST
ncbi:CLUMA_CG001471, isoform C [Clunio marinus]|uniref:CLUMA_CG001471, isoform C n=1 Tax=Clunio marinus TaxID=568069 RepID=A0A1J1HI12_9DIPT|nr:CLUMA_CG001471, isoform C [Clunio marinus]